MYVEPAHRRKGVGRKLLEQALVFADSLPGLRQVTLSVNSASTEAVGLYERMGFRSYGVERGAMLIGDELHDEVHMVRFRGCGT
jgi:ribosomal protein S18 acetylase RimI-like enzyme